MGYSGRSVENFLVSARVPVSIYIMPIRLPFSLFTGEVLKSKSPAEFFADNQNIAGFDNVSVWATDGVWGEMVSSAKDGRWNAGELFLFVVVGVMEM